MNNIINKQYSNRKIKDNNNVLTETITQILKMYHGSVKWSIKENNIKKGLNLKCLKMYLLNYYSILIVSFIITTLGFIVK